MNKKNILLLGVIFSLFLSGCNLYSNKKNEKKRVVITQEEIEKIPELTGKSILFIKDNGIVTKKDKLYGLYNVKTKKYIPEENEEIYFSEENILVKKAGGYYLNGELINIARFYPTKSDVIIYDYKDGFSLFNLRDNKFSNIVYDEIAPNYDEYIIVGKNNKYGIINKYGDREIEYSYDYIVKVGQNSFIGGTDDVGKFALIIEDKQITPQSYDNFIELTSNYYMGMQGNTYRLINKKGKEIASGEKSELISYDSKAVKIKKDGKKRIYTLESDT